MISIFNFLLGSTVRVCDLEHISDAKYYCNTCEIKLCPKCFPTHQKKSHVISKMDQEGNILVPLPPPQQNHPLTLSTIMGPQNLESVKELGTTLWEMLASVNTKEALKQFNELKAKVKNFKDQELKDKMAFITDELSKIENFKKAKKLFEDLHILERHPSCSPLHLQSISRAKTQLMKAVTLPNKKTPKSMPAKPDDHLNQSSQENIPQIKECKQIIGKGAEKFIKVVTSIKKQVKDLKNELQTSLPPSSSVSKSELDKKTKITKQFFQKASHQIDDLNENNSDLDLIQGFTKKALEIGKKIFQDPSTISQHFLFEIKREIQDFQDKAIIQTKQFNEELLNKLADSINSKTMHDTSVEKNNEEIKSSLTNIQKKLNSLEKIITITIMLVFLFILISIIFLIYFHVFYS